MTPDARVLQFPPSATARPHDYGQFSRELSPDELAGCFCFSDDDQRQIARRRGDVNRLGFAVQLGTVRYLGRFLENPAVAPEQVVAWTASEIGVAASTDLAGYGEGEWRWSHQAEIRRAYGYQPFSTPGVEPELVEWLRARAWVTADSGRSLFARASEFLMGRRILLPGWSTLWRLVGTARESADERGWGMLAGTLNAAQRERLEQLLRVSAGQRVTELERLRMAPVEPTIKGLIAALERLRGLRVLADGLGGLGALPHARLRVLMVAAERQRGGELADLRPSRRLATLMAFAARTTRLSTSTDSTAICCSAPRPPASASGSGTAKRSMTPGALSRGPAAFCSATPRGTPRARTPAAHCRCRPSRMHSSSSSRATSTTPTSAPARGLPRSTRSTTSRRVGSCPLSGSTRSLSPPRSRRCERASTR